MKKAIVTILAVGMLVNALPANAWTTTQQYEVHRNKLTTQTILHHHSSKPVVKRVTKAGTLILCRTAYETATSVSKLGFHVWTFGIKAHFCYDGTSVSGIKWDTPYGTTASWTNWDWVQADSYVQAQGGGSGQAYAYLREGGHFSICLWWYCSNRHPWVSLTLRADGMSPGGGSIG